MVASLIDGKKESQLVKDEIKVEIEAIRNTDPTFTPGLAIVQVGDRPDSGVYIKNKLKAAEAVGISAQHRKLPASTTQAELDATIKALNSDPAVHGIIVQLPLETEPGNEINADAALELISGDKDVDGLTKLNAGRLAHNDPATIVPCTPKGCLRLVHSAIGKEGLVGANVVVVGRSNIVGGPASLLFRHANATVTTAHSRTRDLAALCRTADVLVVAIGKKGLIKGAVVIDCGINCEVVDGKNKLFGDVELGEAKEVAGYVTPVPGGVGPMTVAMLLRNTLDQAIAYRKRTENVNGGAC